MAVADTANLLAALTLRDGFTGPLKKMDSSLSRFDAHLSKTQNRSLKAGQQIGTGIKNAGKIAAIGVGLLATQVVLGLNSLAKLEEADAQTEAAIKSTGGVARVTAKDVRGLAESYEALNATIDDKVIQSAENLLLAFTNVHKEAFEPALAAALDLNTALGGGEAGLQGTVKKLGKALNDPAKGLARLSQLGVTFTAAQEKQIKALQKSGDLLGAQNIVLGEIEKRFGGRFAAQGNTAAGAVAGIGDAVEDLQKTVATGLFPVIQKLLPKIRTALADPALLKGVETLGKNIAGLFTDENIATGTQALKGVFETAKAVAPAIQRAAEATGAIIKTSVDLFRSLPPELQALAVGGIALNKITGGLVTNVAGGLAQAALNSRGATPANPVFVSDITKGIGGVGGGLPGAAAQAAPLGIVATGIGLTAGAVAGGVAARLIVGAVAGDEVAGIESGQLHPLGARDPRRFDKNGQVIANYLEDLTHTGDRTYDAIERVRQAAFRTTQAVKDADNTVTVNNSVTATTILNGRVLQANVERFTTKVDSGAPVTAFGGQ